MKKATALAVSGAALLLGSISAHAGVSETSCGLPIAFGNPQASAVLSNTLEPATTGGLYSYNFTVCNLSDPGFFNEENEGRVRGDAIRDWELPWDPAANVTDIMVPDGWSWSIETRNVLNEASGWEGDIEWQDIDDPFYDPRFANHDQALHFYTGCTDFEQPTAQATSSVTVSGPNLDCRSDLENAWILPVGEGPDSLDGFSFNALAGPTNAPYQASWAMLPVNTGDPDNPDGRDSGAGAYTANFLAASAAAAPIPEPSSVALMSLALLAAGRRKKSNA